MLFSPFYGSNPFVFEHPLSFHPFSFSTRQCFPILFLSNDWLSNRPSWGPYFTCVLMVLLYLSFWLPTHGCTSPTYRRLLRASAQHKSRIVPIRNSRLETCISSTSNCPVSISKEQQFETPRNTLLELSQRRCISRTHKSSFLCPNPPRTDCISARSPRACHCRPQYLFWSSR
jgi:hypothetical protein